MSIDQTIQPTGNADEPTTAYARPTAPAGAHGPLPQQRRYDAPVGAGHPAGLPGAYGPPPVPPMPPLPVPPAGGGRRTGLIAAVVGLVVVLLGGGLAAFFVFFGHRTIDPDTVVKEIGRITEQNEKVAPTGITCPDDVPFEKGRTFTCTATLLGKPVTYTITQNDDEGGVTINYTRPVVDPAKVTEQIVATTKKEVGVEPQGVQCPSDVQIKKDTTFTCSATIDGQALTYTLTQTTDDGTDLSIAHDRLVQVKQVDDTLSAALTKEVGEQIVAVCGKEGQTVLVNAPNAPISCGAVNAANTDRGAHVTAKIDADGNLTYTID